MVNPTINDLLKKDVIDKKTHQMLQEQYKNAENTTKQNDITRIFIIQTIVLALLNIALIIGIALFLK